MNLSEETLKALHIASRIAREHVHAAFAAPHLLSALLYKDISTFHTLRNWGKDIFYLEDWAAVRLEEYPKASKKISLPERSDTVTDILAEADQIRFELQGDEVDTLCLLAALCVPGLAFSYDQLKTLTLTKDEIIERVKGSSETEDATESCDKALQPSFKIDHLDKYAIDKNKEVARRTDFRLVERETEIKMCLEVLSRYTRGNLIIMGEPGVGKTALINGLVRRISEGNVPQNLVNTRVFELDLASIQAGAMYKGELEDRFQKLMNELKNYEKPVLIVEELHLLLDKDSNLSPLGNLLAMVMTKGELTVLGITTPEYFRKYIEKDESFSRRFEIVRLEEPNDAETAEIVRAVLPPFMSHHCLEVSNEIIEEAIHLSKRYTKERRLPDAAIDLIDRCMAGIRIANSSTDGETPKKGLNSEDLAVSIAEKTGIPVGKIQTGERERLLDMEEVLRKRVVGQDGAVKSLSEAVLESRSGLLREGQPIGSFFFLGPTGTGKTELAKALSEFLFQDEQAMIRFDMSEFKEEHSAALLYGAPPGYVGYEEGGMLVNKIREKPYSVVLFDEIEKAHASVFDIFLQILDEGKLNDRLGKEGDFSNAVILFTSNIGSNHVTETYRREGRLPGSAELLDVLSGYFRPEFLGRLSEIVPFAPIGDQIILDIFEIHLRELLEIVNRKGIQVELNRETQKYLADLGYSEQYGARPLKSVIRNKIRRPLSRMLVEGKVKSGDIVSLQVDTEKQLKWNIN